MFLSAQNTNTLSTHMAALYYPIVPPHIMYYTETINCLDRILYFFNFFLLKVYVVYCTANKITRRLHDKNKT